MRLTGSRDHFTDQWKWDVVIGREEGTEYFSRVIKKKNKPSILDRWKCRLIAKCFVLPSSTRWRLTGPDLSIVYRLRRFAAFNDTTANRKMHSRHFENVFGFVKPVVETQ